MVGNEIPERGMSSIDVPLEMEMLDNRLVKPMYESRLAIARQAGPPGSAVLLTS